MVDDAGDEEERRLEEGVAEDHRDGGEGGVPVAGAGEQGEEAELADGAVGQDQLEVVEAQGAPAAEQHGGAAEHQDDRLPDGDVGEGRGEPGDQVDTGLHHRGGVQIGADRGGAAMAFGSHMENGQIADFDRAPLRIRTRATEIARVVSGGSATIAEIWYVPAA